MAVDSSRFFPVKPTESMYGPIEALSLQVLRDELEKLQGTLSGDMQMDYSKCVSTTDDFIEELGKCINLSISKYPNDQDVYDSCFDGLQDVINLIHGEKPGIQDAHGQARLMDPQEARMAASERLTEITEDLAFEISRRETAKMAVSRPPAPEVPKKPKGVSPS